MEPEKFSWKLKENLNVCLKSFEKDVKVLGTNFAFFVMRNTPLKFKWQVLLRMNDLDARWNMTKMGVSMEHTHKSGKSADPVFVQSDREKKMWDASKGFESMFFSQMFKAMRKTIHHSELSEPSKGREIFTEFLDNEYAKLSSSDSKNSLAGVLYRQLLRQGGDKINNYLNKAKGPSMNNANAYGVVNPQSKPMAMNGLHSVITAASKRYNVSENLIKSVIQQESAFKPNAVSVAGAKGLMQLMDGTAREMGVKNVYDPVENIFGGTRYLSLLSKMFDGDEKRILAAYNAGPGAVKKYGGIPPFKETRDYVENVLRQKRELDLKSKGNTK